MRGKTTYKRDITPDQTYNSIQVAKLINTIMRRGKKTTAQNIVYSAFDFIATQEDEGAKCDAVDIFTKALKNISPSIETRSRRVGGANYQIPLPVRTERRQALAFRWLLDAAKKRKGTTMSQRLAHELLLAAKGEGDAVKKKLDVQKMAESNRAFAHFAR